MIHEKLLSEVLEEGTLEEKQLIDLTLKAIERKRAGENSYLSGFLDFSSEFVDEDTFQLNVPITPFMMNPLGIVHGGITATIIDITMGRLVRQKLLSPNQGSVTAEMKINYMKAGTGNKLISKAQILHRGKKQFVTECKVYNEQEVLIAAASGTFFII